jgi:hypothetical protein
MANEPSNMPGKQPSPAVLISIVVAATVLLTCCCCGGGGAWLVFFRSGSISVPGLTTARLDPNNVENTRAWAEKAVARLKELEAKGNRAATDAEVARLEKEMRDALLDKKVRWSLVISGVRNDGEVDLDQFFGKDDGKVPDGRDAGKRRRRLYMRIYLAEDGDEVRIGDEINQFQAAREKASPCNAASSRSISASATRTGAPIINGPASSVSSTRFASISSSSASNETSASAVIWHYEHGNSAQNAPCESARPTSGRETRAFRLSITGTRKTPYGDAVGPC